MARRISDNYHQWEKTCQQRFSRLKANEEELNRIFIHRYGLQKELSADVDEKSITVRKADLQREIKSLISYAVGCWFGRYSVDRKGLCYAGGIWDASAYRTIIPIEDNVLLLGESSDFPHDLTSLIITFVRQVYGRETLEENLQFMAEALGGKGTSDEIIRNYLLSEFYADHCKIYQKRPVYWLFDSGKKHCFRALVYLHRWNAQTLTFLRKQYVHRMYKQYQLQMTGLSPEKKQYQLLNTFLAELETYEKKLKLHEEKNPVICLDDGIRSNYNKFSDILAKIK
ncbi:MAG: hypothetical protein IJJ69_03135 [Oscillospiraceae bacterium]|nr:hypothetical protein [Oscillospiraceae bacterium]